MFGFHKNNDDDDLHLMYKETFHNEIRDRYKEYYDWIESNEGKCLQHLETLIIKAYESVNIKADKLIRRLDDSYTGGYNVEDFRVFFKPEVFNKLKEWCKEYERLVQKECVLLETTNNK